ncbi:MAG: hypothetical protein Q9199_006561 [Rusavskia elegans]
MFLFSPILILISLTLTIHALNLASPPPRLHTAAKSEVLCYDARYADHRPAPHDCLTIINHRISPHPNVAKRMRSFSRDPSSKQLPLPHTWETERGKCGVTIDIPGSDSQTTAEATLFDIKEAAREIFVKCVLDDSHLGGLKQVGRGNWLQVRVEAVNQRAPVS